MSNEPVPEFPPVDKDTLKDLYKVLFKNVENNKDCPIEYLDNNWPLYTKTLEERELKKSSTFLQVNANYNNNTTDQSFLYKDNFNSNHTPYTIQENSEDLIDNLSRNDNLDIMDLEEQSNNLRKNAKSITGRTSSAASILCDYSNRFGTVYVTQNPRATTELTRYLIPTHHQLLIPEQDTSYWLKREDEPEDEVQINDHLPVLCLDRSKHATDHHPLQCSIFSHGRFCTQCYFNCPICFSQSKDKIISNNIDIYN